MRFSRRQLFARFTQIEMCLYTRQNNRGRERLMNIVHRAYYEPTGSSLASVIAVRNITGISRVSGSAFKRVQTS